MSFSDALVDRLPGPLQRLARRHHELIKFAVVGATAMLVDLGVYYSLAFSVLEEKPTVAKIIGGIVATIYSYVANREWAFKHRGGREMHHEAALFFIISGIGVVIQALPIYIANNVFDLRQNTGSLAALVILDFVLNYILGNLMQMAFRFWALRRFAFPEDQRVVEEDDEDETEALGHS